MGLVSSCFEAAWKDASSSGSAPTAPKEYSWDKRKAEAAADMSSFIVDGIKSGEIFRKPGQINGEQMMIRNCENCSVFVFDHCNMVTIDDCKNCKIFIGPTKGSVFVRDCSGCVLATACGQFRTRDCHNVTAFLSCDTQPIIEATTQIKFACLQYSYALLRTHFKSSGLSPFNNLWWNIHDFTPVEGEKNWSLLGELYKVSDFLNEPPPDVAKEIGFDSSLGSSVVPLSIGSRSRDHRDTCLVVVFSDASHDAEDTAEAAVRAMEHRTQTDLVRASKINLQASDFSRIFETKAFDSACQKGPIVALQFIGPDCVSACKTMSSTLDASSPPSFISPDSATAARHAHNFFAFVDMQMSG